MITLLFEFYHCFQSAASVTVSDEGSGEDCHVSCDDDYDFVIFVQDLHNRPFAIMESYHEADLWFLKMSSIIHLEIVFVLFKYNVQPTELLLFCTV